MGVPISIRIPDEEKEKLQNSAKELGMKSLAELLRTGGNLLASFDPGFWELIKRASERSNLSESYLIEYLATRSIAQIDAKREVYKGPAILEGLRTTLDGPEDGKDLYKRLFEIFVEDYKTEKSDTEQFDIREKTCLANFKAAGTKPAKEPTE
jgi:hypothetical protein